MSTIQEHYANGRLAEALAAATEAVKKSPSDVSARQSLVEMLCFTGDFARADTHLDLMGTRDTAMAVRIALVRQIVRGEVVRQQCFSEGRVPELLAGPTPTVEHLLKLQVALRAGDQSAAAEHAKAAAAARPKCAGTLGGKAFDDFRDWDDRVSGVLEAITPTGKYYWIPVEQVVSLKFMPLETLMDVLWRPVEMQVKDGPDGVVYLPALYAGTASVADELVKLGRLTTWDGSLPGVNIAAGHRVFRVGDADVALHELGDVTFAGA